MFHSTLALLMAVALYATSCSGLGPHGIAQAASDPAQAPAPAAPTPEAPASAAPAKDGHGNVAAAPGSYEDWCGEHEVPESQCTRCNESLIPAFKATKDWCVEHDLPESQCLKCDPKRKAERPPKPAEK